MIPVAVIANGNINIPKSDVNSTLVLEMTKTAHVDSAKDPKRSLPIPAMSPTLSPTLSAIVAGFLGSSSGRS